MTRRAAGARVVGARVTQDVPARGRAALASPAGWPPGRGGAPPPAVPTAACTDCGARPRPLARLRPGLGPEGTP